MTKFEFATLRPLCKSMFNHWQKASKIDTNIVNGGGTITFPTGMWIFRILPLGIWTWVFELNSGFQPKGLLKGPILTMIFEAL